MGCMEPIQNASWSKEEKKKVIMHMPAAVDFYNRLSNDVRSTFMASSGQLQSTDSLNEVVVTSVHLEHKLQQ